MLDSFRVRKEGPGERTIHTSLCPTFCHGLTTQSDGSTPEMRWPIVPPPRKDSRAGGLLRCTRDPITKILRMWRVLSLSLARTLRSGWCPSPVLYSHNTCRPSSWKVSVHVCGPTCVFYVARLTLGQGLVVANTQELALWIYFHPRDATQRGTVTRGIHSQDFQFLDRKCVCVSCGP